MSRVSVSLTTGLVAPPLADTCVQSNAFRAKYYAILYHTANTDGKTPTLLVLHLSPGNKIAAVSPATSDAARSLPLLHSTYIEQ